MIFAVGSLVTVTVLVILAAIGWFPSWVLDLVLGAFGLGACFAFGFVLTYLSKKALRDRE